MNKITLNAERYNAAVRNLSEHFGYDKLKQIKSDESVIIETDYDLQEMQSALNTYIDRGTEHVEIIDTLHLVSYALQTDNLGRFPKVSDTCLDWIRADLLQLYLAIYDDTDTATWVSITTVHGTIRLRNFCNWFMDGMVKEHLRKNLPGVTSVKQAEDELKSLKVCKGRVPTGPRIAVLMWGIYTLILKFYDFRSHMPDRLCQFIIAYLQILEIIPYDTEIDIFWVRAQLRYIQTEMKNKE